MKRYITLYALLICFLAASSLQAEFPSTINYQGRLVSGTELVNAMVEMHFRLYTEPVGGDLLFECTNHVLVVDGLYAAEIGENVTHGTLQEALKNYPVYLEVEVDGDILSPRERFSAVPYAFSAQQIQRGAVAIISENGNVRYYASLTTAVATVQSGESIHLYPGEHLIEAHPVGNTDNFSNAGILFEGKHDISLIGQPNAVIVSPSHGDFIFIRNSHDIKIEGITFRGLGPNPGTDNLFAMINLRGTNTRITIQNCRFMDFGNHGISHLRIPQQSTFIHVLNNHFENGGDTLNPHLTIDGAAVSGIGSDWLVSGNTVHNCLRGIEIEGQGQHHRIVIANNILTDIWNHGIMLFPSSGNAADFTDILIANNVLKGANPRPYEIDDGNGIVIRGGERIVIQGNVIDGFQSFAGIDVMSLTAAIRDCMIVNNRIHGQKRRGIQVVRRHHANENVLISGNHVTDSGDRGIIVSGRNHSVIQNVTTRNTGQTGAGIHIYVENDLTENILVSGNQSHANKIGLLINENVGHVELHPNHLFDNTQFDLQDLRE